MNICMYASEFPPGGGGISSYVYNLSKLLLHRGHKVCVVTRGDWRKTYHEYIDGISVYRVQFIPSFPNPFKIHGILVNKLFKKLERDIDILHEHGFLGPVIKTNAPTILTLHGTAPSDLDNIQVKSIHFLFVKLLRTQIVNAEKELIKNADIVTAVSESCRKELIQSYKLKKEIWVIGNGVDTKFFSPAMLNKNNGHRCILYSGRLETIKGLSDLVKCSKYVSQYYPNVLFILAGRGTIKKYLEREISYLNLEKNFLFAGFLSSSDLLKYYQNSTLCVLPSYYEGMPTSLLEAMSCGLPCIATDVGGNSELICSGETGLLVPPRSPKQLAEAIKLLLDDENLRAKIGIKSRNYVVNNYDWEIITSNIEEIYKKIV